MERSESRLDKKVKKTHPHSISCLASPYFIFSRRLLPFLYIPRLRKRQGEAGRADWRTGGGGGGAGDSPLKA
ncbi:hypothetical protein E2C01_093363 [Portunus trituberculatus]|uniref:Uncharacterized protein n=1 Tax=Portunus trituberculatus TaxID=210409 RepID=A0A5B7K0B1_PORTR|nr:hypothetical protein [Portunus trituberculatus]